VGVAALLSGVLKLPNQKVLIPLTGGNIDINLVGRFSNRLPIMQREESITLETRDRSQCEELLSRLRAADYTVWEAEN
jgi:threonine dehydratase